MAIAVGPGPESVGILIYAANPDAGRWDRATWDGAIWGAPGWQSVGCDVTDAALRWGSAEEAGILSIASAGELDLSTFDPLRELDPLNTASPYYGYIRPGTPVRIVGYVPAETIVATAFIDEASYDVASARGRLRCVDGLAYLAQAQLAEGVALSNTLRARVREIVAAVGLTTVVPVEPEAATDPDVDPAVSPHDGKSKPAWQAIADAAVDALWYVWIDPTGTLRFRSWGALPEALFNVGCPPLDSAGETWLEGLSTIETTASADAVRNRVRAYSSGTTWATAVTDPASIAKYGPRPFDVERVVPDFATWAGRILADRADAGLDIGIGELRPYTVAELDALLAAQLVGPQVIRARDDSHGEEIDIDVGMIGAQIGVTPAGWRFALATIISRVAWEDITPEPPEPIPPDPEKPWHTETRDYTASSDALVALTSGGAKYGAGAASSLPVGVWAGWTYRSLLRFPSIPWANVRALKTATLRITTSDQDRVGFGSSPKAEIRRITSDWSAGSSSSPSSGNAVVWPGPNTTTSGAVRDTYTTAENNLETTRIDAIVRAWAPSAIGGSGAKQYGIALIEASGSTSNTTEFWPVEHGSSTRAVLRLELEIYD